MCLYLCSLVMWYLKRTYHVIVWVRSSITVNLINRQNISANFTAALFQTTEALDSFVNRFHTFENRQQFATYGQYCLIRHHGVGRSGSSLLCPLLAPSNPRRHLSTDVGLARFQTSSFVVWWRQVRHLHSLGRVFCAEFRVRVVLVELAGSQGSALRRLHEEELPTGLQLSGVRERLQGRVLWPGWVGGHIQSFRSKVRWSG